mmetsp:Transcript_18936/g.26677  ORF Transcript_18936/g.26677 Transcript_18936/m.26677 type:complete len:503 (-) Transcript_18936:27-1535(-)
MHFLKFIAALCVSLSTSFLIDTFTSSKSDARKSKIISRSSPVDNFDPKFDRRSFVLRILGLISATNLFNCFDFDAKAVPLKEVKFGSPILTESVLLDLLPISGKTANVLQSIQKEIEKATILRTLSNKISLEGKNITIPAAVWDQVSLVSNRALEMLNRNRVELEPVFREVDNAEVQIRRAERGEIVFDETRSQLIQMKNASDYREVEKTLIAQQNALLHLGAMGELLVPAFPFKITTDEQYDSIPHLLGRALVDLVIRKDQTSLNSTIAIGGNSTLPLKNVQSTFLGNITLVVDGYSAPVNSGNFIDLCLRGFYNDLQINFDKITDVETKEEFGIVIGGTYKGGFVDPVSGNIRRLPLEILRYDEKLGNVPFYGAARNTRIFTKSPPVQTFTIPGAVATYHSPNDRNGGSSQFFCFLDENLNSDGMTMKSSIQSFDGKYSIFGYIISDSNQISSQLKDTDHNTSYYIDKAIVNYGADNLLKTRAASFKTLLMNKGYSNDEE